MIFDEVIAIVEQYGTGVLVVVEDTGYPLSLRCVPIIQKDKIRLELQLPSNLNIPSGDARFLCHWHDNYLNNLQSVTIWGDLKKEENGYYFNPTRISKGLGHGSVWDKFKNTLLKPRRQAQIFLKRHNLSRPKIDWHELDELTDN